MSNIGIVHTGNSGRVGADVGFVDVEAVGLVVGFLVVTCVGTLVGWEVGVAAGVEVDIGTATL